jgi:hypothetical protein
VRRNCNLPKEDESRIFDSAMSSKSHRDITPYCPAYDFSQFATIADIAGGRGHLRFTDAPFPLDLSRGKQKLGARTPARRRTQKSPTPVY